jgi:hypothetical protein
MADKPDSGLMSADDTKPFKKEKPTKRAGVEDITVQAGEVFQKEDNLWYFVIREADGSITKEWTQGMSTEFQAIAIAESMFADINTSVNRSRKYKTHPL